MPRRKGLGLPPKRRVKLESLEVNHAGIRVSVDPKGHTNGYSGHSSSEEETNKGLVNGDLSKLNSLKSSEENTMENGLPASESEKFLYTHKKFKKMATIAPFNYNVSSPSPPPVKPPPPILLKMPPHPQAAPCSPSPEYLHRHISKLISENQAIVETSDPFLSRKHWQRAKQEKDAPPSPSRIKSVAPRPVHPALPLPPPEWRALMNYPPVPSPQQFSGGYEAAYVKSLMSSPSPSSPLSSASSSSSTEFSWPRKSGAPPPTPQQHPPSPSPWQYEMLLAKQQVESKLATALLRPNASHMSSNPSPDEDQSCQPLNLTVKPAGQVDSKPQRRKRTFNSSFPDEAVERVTFADAGRVSSEAESQPKPKALFTRPEDDSKSQYSNRYQPNATDNASDGRISRHLNIFDMTQLCKRVRNTSYASPPLVKATGMAVGKSASSPVKVSPPLPSPGPLLGSTPLVDPRSHIPTLRSLEELSRVPMRQHLFQMFGGKVEIRDATGDAKTMRIEPNKACGDGASVATTSVVTVAKSSGLNSGGTTILQVPADSPTTHPVGMNLGNDMLIIPVMSKPTTSSAPMGGSASPYNGGVLTLLHAGKAIPHVPGIPGPLSLQQWGEDKGPRGKLSAEVKPIVKNGRVPSLSEPAESTKPGDDHCQALPSSAIHPLTPHLLLTSCGTLDSGGEDDKSSRFLRPTSLPLKPGTYTPKRHLSSPPASQSLVSPETPRPRKGYGQLYLNGHAYTYLGLKCSTRLFFCTLNKPQPLYAPLSPEHAKVSMYSNWKICSEVDPNPFGLSPAQLMTCYSSSPRPAAYTVARARTELLQVTHSSYWSKRRGKKARVPGGGGGGGTQERAAKSPLPPALPVPVGALVPEVVLNEEEGSPPHIPEEKPKRRKIFTGGFESNEEYIYIRGRGRGRFVCEECGIRCRKPSMLKKHIRTHSDVRLYACTFCSFSFKTKGNLTKHMKSKAHFKKCVELGVSPMPSSEDLSGDETKDYRNDRSSESMDTEPGESDDEYDDDDYDDEDDDIDEEDDDEDDSEDDQKSEDEDRVNSELEHDVAHSLLSLAQMPPQSESSGLPLPSARPSTYPYSSSTASTTTVITTLNAMCTTTMITLPSATAVSVLPKVRDSEKAAMSILPPSSPNSTRRQAEFLPPSSGPTPTYVSLLSDGRSMCGICNKIFTKPSQLRLHVNIHYFERPFRCETCAVSFRTKGHLQKHQRSSSHLNKVNMNSTFGAPTTTNPRPFKCDDCKIAFRIHGHLAKHLRSKMHIMKLECGGKLPFGTYAELERCGYNLNDIDTTDCDNSLESLQLLAQKLYEKDPSKLGGWGPDMLSGVGGGGGGALHTSGSGESSDEGESLEPALCAPLLKTEPALSPVRPSA